MSRDTPPSQTRPSQTRPSQTRPSQTTAAPAAPGRRPPWWPADEAWPPLGADGQPDWSQVRLRGPWRRPRAGRGGPPYGWGHPSMGFGCVFAVVFVVGITILVSVVGSIVVATLWGGSEGGGPPIRNAAFAVLLLGIVAFLVAGRIVRRSAGTLDQLLSATRRVEGGDYGVRVDEPLRGPRPVRELVAGFNTMTERLEADERLRRSLLADVSHELRTPLAVLQGNLEALLDGVHEADERHLSALLDETRVVGRLVEDLRTLALSETGTLPLHPEPTDLSIVAGEVAASFRTGADAAGISLEADIDDGVPLLDVDPVRTREVVSNLVANALRYTPRGGSIRIAGGLERDGRWVRVRVVDTGAGIAPDVLPHVFDRFWKSSESRGSGLGLPIARNLVEAHGGQIGAESTPGSGTTIWFRLPLRQTD